MRNSGLIAARDGRFFGRAALAVAGLLLGSALTAAPSQADPLSASYEVYFGGFHVLNADALWQRNSESYKITAEAETQGFIGWLNPWKGATESYGRIAAGKILPQHHENRGSSSKGEKSVLLRYDGSGDLAESRVLPLQEDDEVERHPLPDDAGAGTLDPLSVIAGLSELLQANGRCEGEFSVFDGRRRYDLIVTDGGEAQIRQSDYSIYAGTARACRLDYKLLGGHRVERNKYAETARERLVFVARPAEGAPLIPVRLQIETDYGTVMGHLTGFAQGEQAIGKLAQTQDETQDQPQTE